MENHNNQTALGMVETYGYIAHIEAADACLKAANIRLIGTEKVKGGFMLVKVMGDVGAVKAAVDAAEAAVEVLGLQAVTHVIPRPSPDVQKLIFSKQADVEKSTCDVDRQKNDQNESDGKAVPEEIKEETNKKIQEKVKAQRNKADKEISEIDESDLDIDKLSKMNVARLRIVARSLKGISLDKNQINFGKKQELITAILDCIERRGE